MPRLMLSRALALVAFIPFCLLSAPVIIYTDWKWGRGNKAAREAQQRAMQNSLTLRPFMWAHRVLLCRGNANCQRW